jgi:hypothetical protein
MHRLWYFLCSINQQFAGQAAPLWCSIKNGVFLCFKCAVDLQTETGNENYCQPINSAGWTDAQIQHFCMGGNKRFNDYMQAYELIEINHAKKYNTKAAEFYRKRVF